MRKRERIAFSAIANRPFEKPGKLFCDTLSA